MKKKVKTSILFVHANTQVKNMFRAHCVKRGTNLTRALTKYMAQVVLNPPRFMYDSEYARGSTSVIFAHVPDRLKSQYRKICHDRGSSMTVQIENHMRSVIEGK